MGGKYMRNIDHSDMSKFKNRLWCLMLDNGIKTPLELAKVLYNANLVSVKQNSESYNEPFKDINNAYGSVEKKIRKHCKTDTAREVQGEFILAYCLFFGCSADYLLGFTDIRSNNMDIRQICEKTKLSEEAVKRVIGSPVQTAWWSKLFETQLFIDLPAGWIHMLQELHVRYTRQNKSKPTNEIMSELKDAGKLEQRHLIVHSAFKAGVEVETAELAYYGYLAKVNSQVTEYFLKGTEEQFNTAVNQAAE